jgi:hypothetical protein
MSEQTTNAHMAASFIDQFSDSQSETKVTLTRGEMVERAQRFCLSRSTDDEDHLNHIRFRLDFGLMVEFINENFPR